MSIRNKSILERLLLYALILIFMVGNYRVWRWGNDQSEDIARIEENNRKIKDSIGQMAGENERLREQIEQMRGLSDELQQKRMKVQDSLPVQDNMPQLIEKLHRIARNSGIMITASTFGRPETRILREYRVMRFQMSVLGDYPAVKKFFQQVEEMSWKINVDSLFINKFYDDRGMMDVDIVISTYILGAMT